MDYGHKQTEKELAALERKIAKIYSEASEELKGTIEDYFANFEKRDKHQLELLNAGKITEDQYKQWRLAQIGRGERFKALQKKVAERYTEANKVAVSYVNDATPGIYSLNRNYAAYEIERAGGNIDFTLWDERTVRRLIVEEPEVMPYYPPEKALNRGIDLAWGKRQISASVTGGILQGKSTGKIATDLQSRMENMNRTSAIRTARTAMTGAQNAGRMDSYAAAEKKGIKLEKEWLATLDGRTRHQHRVLDGQHTATGKPFEVEGQKIMFPGDPTAAPWLVYNCRCTLIARVKGVDTSDALRRDQYGLMSDMTYAQWETSKRGAEAPPVSPFRRKEVDDWHNSLQNKRNLDIIKQRIASGEYSLKLSKQQHKKHVEGTAQFKQYLQSRLAAGKTPQSIILISEEESQEIINKYSGTGTVKVTKDGKPTHIEFVDTEMVVGRFFKDDAFHDTKRVAIHHGKIGSHIIPVEEKSDG